MGGGTVTFVTEERVVRYFSKFSLRKFIGRWFSCLPRYNFSRGFEKNHSEWQRWMKLSSICFVLHMFAFPLARRRSISLWRVERSWKVLPFVILTYPFMERCGTSHQVIPSLSGNPFRTPRRLHGNRPKELSNRLSETYVEIASHSASFDNGSPSSPRAQESGGRNLVLDISTSHR